MRPRDIALALVLALVPASAQAQSQDEEQQLPQGHPQVSPQQQPHGHGGGIPGMFEPPEDTVQDDAKLPAGTIAVELRDPDDKPLGKTLVTLGILTTSVAKGESRRRVEAQTDDKGVATFDKLETGSGIAYRVSTMRESGTFAAPPFNLPLDKGMRVVLHVYPVTSDVSRAVVVVEAILYSELKDDRIQVQQAYRIYNLGRTAWIPKDVVLELPKGFTALTSQQGMSDVGVDPVPGQGARIRGTFGPGQNVIEYRWQLPWSGKRQVEMDVELPPHVAIARVMAPASDQMKLDVAGFPEAKSDKDQQGQTILWTRKELTRDDPPLKRLTVTLRDLPTAGPFPFLATSAAALVVALGIALSITKRASTSGGGDAGKELRDQLLADLEELEAARATGDVGPKTYERARREIIDEIARTLSGQKASA